VDLPILIYNIPPRSVIDMAVPTMARLAAHRNIAGVKDSTADLARPIRTRLACGPGFIQLSGEDGTALAFNAAGGVGCISVTGNVAPKLCAQMQAAWRAGDYTAAMALQDRLMPLHDALFVETNPAPVKHAAGRLGFGTGFCRLPLAPLSAPAMAEVDAAMAALGLLPP
jgi:4-hydroxy-tetrahydrodipicolinate synthase